MTDVVVNKIQSIQRCVARARQEYQSDPDGFPTNFTIQDAAILNILRACEQAIDLANHVIRLKRLGIPNSSSESFELMAAGKVIDSELSERLAKMTRFRNVVTHEYRRLNVDIVRSVILSGLNDLIEFGDVVHRFLK